MLKKNGFEVISPRKIGMNGRNDIEHLKCAIVNNAVLLTEKSYLVNLNFRTDHKGILIVYRYSNPSKDMTLVKIIKALKNIEKQIRENNINLDNKIYPLNIFL